LNDVKFTKVDELDISPTSATPREEMKLHSTTDSA